MQILDVAGTSDDDDYQDADGVLVDIDHAQSLLLRAGLRLSKVYQRGTQEFLPYLRVGVVNEFDGDGEATFNGHAFDIDGFVLGYEVAAGFTHELNTKVCLHLQGKYIGSENMGGQIEARMGISYRF